jgi:hypothetical protein
MTLNDAIVEIYYYIVRLSIGKSSGQIFMSAQNGAIYRTYEALSGAG